MISGKKMASDDLDVEAMLEAPYQKEVKYVEFRHTTLFLLQ